MAYPGYNGSHGHNNQHWQQQQQPPPQQGYGYPQQHQQYAPPPGPPPPHHNHQQQQHYQPHQQSYNQYPPPSGPPPPQSYGGYAPPSGPPPPSSSYHRHYPPPSHPPPPGLDTYGYRMQTHAPPPPPSPGYGYRSNAPPPPHNPQQFGHGAPEGYTFQYSNCTGKRKALLIGINYFGQDGELRGCINDTKNLSEFLIERYGYRHEDMVILTDDQSDPVRQPTRSNILKAMNWLVGDAKPDDALFLHYSGHGGQTEDKDGDEDDGIDEVIYPVDFKSAGHIVDDEIHYVVVKPLVAGVRLTAIFDSCHSGTVMDLPYIYSTKGVLKEPNLAAEAGEGLLTAFSAYTRGDMMGVASSVFGFAKSAYMGNDAHRKTKETRTSPADVIMWSGSKDDQTSADATIEAQATGAMSWAFMSALKKEPKQSYVELLNSIRDILETKYTQKPQLSCSHPLDTNLLFVM